MAHTVGTRNPLGHFVPHRAHPCGARGGLLGTESPTATSWVRDASPLLRHRAQRAANLLRAKSEALLENRTQRNLKVPGLEGGGKSTHTRARGIMN